MLQVKEAVADGKVSLAVREVSNWQWTSQRERTERALNDTKWVARDRQRRWCADGSEGCCPDCGGGGGERREATIAAVQYRIAVSLPPFTHSHGLQSFGRVRNATSRHLRVCLCQYWQWQVEQLDGVRWSTEQVLPSRLADSPILYTA